MAKVRIEPTVGRVVHYYHRDPAHDDPETEAQIIGPQAALLCGVNADGTINVAHFDEQGNCRPATNVLLLQDEDAEPDEETLNWAEWMPFQKGQAQKTEELEKAVRGSGSSSKD
jgi:hypothetical protein